MHMSITIYGNLDFIIENNYRQGSMEEMSNADEVTDRKCFVCVVWWLCIASLKRCQRLLLHFGQKKGEGDSTRHK